MSKNHSLIEEFAGKCRLNDNALQSPVLFGINKHGKYLKWQICVGIVDISGENGADEPILMAIDAHMQKDPHEEMSDGTAGAYWTRSGQEGGTIKTSAMTIIYEGKNGDRKNATTAFSQALFDARGLFEKRIRHGFMQSREILRRQNEDISIKTLAGIRERGKYPWRVFAMAMHNYNKYAAKIKFPASIQDKRDGTLFIVVYSPDIPGGIDGYSRGRETMPGQDHILHELRPILERSPGLHLVGELWKEGYSLQEISGRSRKEDAANDDNLLRFNIFDCFHLEKPLTFRARQKELTAIFTPTVLAALAHTELIPTLEVNSDDEVRALNQQFLDRGLEGSVIRNWSGLYEFGINKEIRSYDVLKLKPRDDAEWPVVSYTTGKGKENGLVIWTCAENDVGVKERTGKLLPLDERKTFNVTPNQPQDLRRHIYDKLENTDIFERLIKGQLMTISYSILSADLLPQQPKMLHFRDAVIDEELAE